MTTPFMLAHGENLITILATLVVAGTCAGICFIIAIGLHFSTKQKDKTVAGVFALAGLVFLLLILMAPMLAHAFHLP